MTKKILTCTMPDGTIAQRKTNHAYRFALIGRVDVTRSIERSMANAPLIARREFGHYSKLARGETTSSFQSAEDAREKIGGLDATVESYTEVLRQRYLKRCREEYGEGATVGKWEALAWSTRQDLIAARMASEVRNEHYRDLQIVPVMEKA